MHHKLLRSEAEKYIDEFEKDKEAAGYEKATDLFSKASINYNRLFDTPLNFTIITKIYLQMNGMFSLYDKVFIDILENTFEDSIGKQVIHYLIDHHSF